MHIKPLRVGGMRSGTDPSGSSGRGLRTVPLRAGAGQQIKDLHFGRVSCNFLRIGNRPFLGVWAAPGPREALPKGGGLPRAPDRYPILNNLNSRVDVLSFGSLDVAGFWKHRGCSLAGN